MPSDDDLDDKDGMELVDAPSVGALYLPCQRNGRYGRISIARLNVEFRGGETRPAIFIVDDTTNDVRAAPLAFLIEDAEILGAVLLNTCADIRRELALEAATAAVGAAGPVGEG